MVGAVAVLDAGADGAMVTGDEFADVSDGSFTAGWEAGSVVDVVL